MSNALIKIRTERIERAIHLIRGEKVMLDRDLAELYEVTTKALNQAVKRNQDRFPQDFMFQITSDELDQLNRSQSVTGSQKHRDPRFRPFAFTEQGVAMLSSVLRSKRAVAVNVEIMRAFVRLRAMLASNAQLAKKIEALEQKYDSQFKVVFTAIKKLMLPPDKPKGGIGFANDS